MSSLFNDSGAQFSIDKKYRFGLWRFWDKQKPSVMIVGLNPSTANDVTDDPTIRRVKSIAANLGYGGFYMVNLYPFVTAYPSQLDVCDFNQLDFNKDWIEIFRPEAQDIVFAWGNFKQAAKQAEIMIRRHPEGLCFGKNKNGSPKHPLYLKSDTQLIKFNS